MSRAVIIPLTHVAEFFQLTALVATRQANTEGISRSKVSTSQHFHANEAALFRGMVPCHLWGQGMKITTYPLGRPNLDDGNKASVEYSITHEWIVDMPSTLEASWKEPATGRTALHSRIYHAAIRPILRGLIRKWPQLSA